MGKEQGHAQTQPFTKEGLQDGRHEVERSKKRVRIGGLTERRLRPPPRSGGAHGAID